MNFYNLFRTGICACVLLISSCLGADNECTIPESAVYPFAEQNLHLGKEKLRSLIQAAADKMYLKGFSYLGDPRDFDHGHMLYPPDEWENPVLILYHTQEDAYYHHSVHPGSQFDYLDRSARNWVQWINNGKVANATGYSSLKFDYTADWDHFIVNPWDLEAKKLDVEFNKLYSIQWFFTDVTGKNIPAGCMRGNSNLIEIKLPDGEIKLLALLNDSHYWPYYENHWEKENK